MRRRSADALSRFNPGRRGSTSNRNGPEWAEMDRNEPEWTEMEF